MPSAKLSNRSTTGGQFIKNIANWNTRVEMSAERNFHAIGKRLISAVVSTSPVDTSFFVSNWTIARSEKYPVARFGTYNDLLRKKRKGDLSYQNAIKQQVVDLANSAVEKIKLMKSKAKPSFGMGNETPYALRLEEGYSGQAPNGVLKVAIQAEAKR